eukprot:5846580-Prymnesium_polylepis.1
MLMRVVTVLVVVAEALVIDVSVVVLGGAARVQTVWWRAQEHNLLVPNTMRRPPHVPRALAPLPAVRERRRAVSRRRGLAHVGD